MRDTKHSLLQMPLNVIDHGSRAPVRIADKTWLSITKIETGSYNDDIRVAAFIVRACNEHDKLLAAAEWLVLAYVDEGLNTECAEYIEAATVISEAAAEECP